jgi:hypothetical protein
MAQRTFGRIARMIGYRRVEFQRQTEPDLVRAGGLALKPEPERLQPFDDVAMISG